MFENFTVDYRRLLPSRSTDESADDSIDYGIYEDEESIAQRRNASGEGDDSVLNHPYVNYFCSMLPSLSLRERLLGCATCMICGYLLSFGSFVRLKDLLFGNPTPIVVHVTMGNVLSLMGTCFLSGPSSQIRRMYHESRRVATVMYLGSIGLSLLLLVTPGHFGKGFLLFLLLCFQYVAVTWYVLMLKERMTCFSIKLHLTFYILNLPSSIHFIHLYRFLIGILKTGIVCRTSHLHEMSLNDFVVVSYPALKMTDKTKRFHRKSYLICLFIFPLDSYKNDFRHE